MRSPTRLVTLALTALAPACGDDAAAFDAPPGAPDAAVDAAAPPDRLALPGDAYYPENLHAAPDGTLYVGSLVTGAVVAFPDGATTPTPVLAGGGADGVTAVAGVLVHDDALWVCSVDTAFARPNEVRRFTRAGQAVATYPLAAGRFCNDLAFDGAGALYVTDSFAGTILRLAPGGAAFEPWVDDAALAPAPGQFGLDGIAWNGVDAVYVDKLDSGGLYRIAIGAGGAAGAITPIAVTPPLTAPDGLRAVDADTLLVIEGGHLTRVEVSGATATATPIATDLDMPTGVVVARGAAWVSEGQLGRLFAQPPVPPHLPFLVRRVAL